MTSVNWVTARPTLGTWITTVTGLSVRDREGSQNWGGSLTQATPLRAEVLLHIADVRGIGWPAHEKLYNSGASVGEEIEPHVRSIREVRWEIQVRSLEISAGFDAPHYLGLIRSYLHAPGPDGFTVLASGLGLGVQGAEAVVDLTETIGKRRMSIGQMDVRLHAYVDQATPAYGYVDQIEATSDWKGPDGNSLPAENQIDEELIP